MRMLSAGIDSLYWTARAEVGTWWEQLTAAKLRAQEARQPVVWAVVDGFGFFIRPHGMGKYPVALEASEFQIRLTDAEHIPTVYVQLRSPYIHEVGIERAIAESTAVASQIVGHKIEDPRASRVDVYADFADWRLLQADREGIVTHAEIAAYFRAGTDEYQSLRAGSDGFKVRVYRKDIEVRKRGGHAPLFWGGFTGPVTRVEVQADSEALRRFTIQTCSEALASYGDIWRHGTTKFLVFRKPGSGARERWPVTTEWKSVQEAGITSFPVNGLVPFHQVKGDKIKVLQGIRGGLISLGAHLGLRDLDAVLRAVPGELAQVDRGRSFAEEAEKKFARLPKSVRAINRGGHRLPDGPSGAGKKAKWPPRFDGKI